MIRLVNHISVILFLALFLLTPLGFLGKVIVYYSVFLVWFITAIVSDLSFILKSLKYLLFIAFFGLLYFFLSVSDPSIAFRPFIHTSFFTYIWPVFYIYYASRTNQISHILFLAYLFVLISCVFTIYGNIVVPGASRSLASTIIDLQDVRIQAHDMFVGGYGFIYATAFLLAPMALFMRESKKLKRLAAVVGIIIVFISLVTASYFMSILIGVAVLIFALSESNSLARYAIMVIIFMIGIFVFEKPILEGLASVGETIDSKMLVTRAEQQLYGTYQEDYDLGGDYSRIERWKNGIENYLSSPFVGSLAGRVNNSLPSGHSELIGYFEKYGLFALVFVWYFISIFRLTLRRFQTERMRVQYFSSFFLFLVFISVNTFEVANQVGLVLFFLLPISFQLIESRGNQ